MHLMSCKVFIAKTGLKADNRTRYQMTRPGEIRPTSSQTGLAAPVQDKTPSRQQDEVPDDRAWGGLDPPPVRPAWQHQSKTRLQADNRTRYQMTEPGGRN